MKLENIKNGLSKYFKIWWIPILSYFFPFVIFLIGDGVKSNTIIDLSLIIFFVNILGNLVSSIVQIFIKKWFYLIPQIGISFFLFFYVSLFFTFSPPDYYGANKTIPKGIEIYKPLESNPTKSDFEKNDFILSLGGQPGIYNYHTNIIPTELGNYYIKAYEITSNDKLSEERIKLRSRVKIENFESKIYEGEFTIYEGSWGDKYGSRIELWFEPSNGNADYIIARKNYIVEGWMR